MDLRHFVPLAGAADYAAERGAIGVLLSRLVIIATCLVPLLAIGIFSLLALLGILSVLWPALLHLL